MSTTTDYRIEWHEADLRPQGKDDPAFYTYYGTHTLVCTVHHNNRSVEVAVDGEMRVYDNESGEEARNADYLSVLGLHTDDDIVASQSGDKYQWLNNTWFDLYDANEMNDGHLDCVHFSLSEAIEQAVALCAEGTDLTETDIINKENN